MLRLDRFEQIDELTYIESTMIVSALKRSLETLKYELEECERHGFKLTSEVIREEIETLKAIIDKIDNSIIHYKKYLKDKGEDIYV